MDHQEAQESPKCGYQEDFSSLDGLFHTNIQVVICFWNPCHQNYTLISLKTSFDSIQLHMDHQEAQKVSKCGSQKDFSSLDSLFLTNILVVICFWNHWHQTHTLISFKTSFDSKQLHMDHKEAQEISKCGSYEDFGSLDGLFLTNMQLVICFWNHWNQIPTLISFKTSFGSI